MFLSSQQRVQSLLKSSSDVYSKVNQIFYFKGQTSAVCRNMRAMYKTSWH